MCGFTDCSKNTVNSDVILIGEESFDTNPDMTYIDLFAPLVTILPSDNWRIGAEVGNAVENSGASPGITSTLPSGTNATS